MIEAARLAGFVIAATAVFFVLGSDEARDRTAFVFYLTAAAIVKGVGAVARVYLAPMHPGARIPDFEDHDARVLYRAVLRTTAFGAFGFFTCALIASFGLSGDSHTLLLILVGTLTTVLLTHSLWDSRHAIAGDLGGDIAGERHDPGQLRLGFARLWPNVLVLFAPLLWIGLVLTVLTERTPLFGAALYMVFLGLLMPSVDAALWRQTRGSVAIGKPALAAGLRVTRLGLIVLACLSLATAWRIDLLGFASDSIGAGAASAALQILITMFVAYGVWQAVGIWIDRLIAEEDRRRAAELGVEDLEIDEQGGTGHSRLRTLLPIVRRAAQIVLGVLVVLIALSALGVDTGPLLAGAGVVGLAVGFGSQSLVRDIVSGLFFLLDDAFRVGEYVEIGKIRGTVERISVRSFQLRHHKGAIHTIPYGEIQHLTNYSRDWAIMKFELRVPFETDINAVRKINKKVGVEMMEDPELGPDLLEPLKSQGVNRMDDSALIIRCKFTAIPGKQFVARREAFTRIQKAFEEKGIKFAPRRVLVETVTPATAVAAAAAGAMDQELPTGGAVPSDRG